MALEVYAQEDILNVLRALHVSSEVPAALSVAALQGCGIRVESRKAGSLDGCETFAEREAFTADQLMAYQKGFRTALASVALAFGLVPLASSAPVAPSRSGPSGSGQCFEVDLRSFIESMVCSNT